MQSTQTAWRSIGMPVAVCITVFSAVNGVVNLLGLPHVLPVYLIAGSSLSLFFVARASRARVLTPGDLGLAEAGWKPHFRMLGLVLTVSLGYAGFANLHGAAAQPDFTDYCFWFMFLLPASLAELLVFVSIGFCLPERWLESCGLHPFVAFLAAALFAGVAFGLFHFTHEPRWHQYALMLIPMMWLDLLYFTLTRNFHLTLFLHNAFAAVGFTQEQYRSAVPDPWVDPKTYQTPLELGMTIASFMLPYLVLNALEARMWKPRSPTGRVLTTAVPNRAFVVDG